MITLRQKSKKTPPLEYLIKKVLLPSKEKTILAIIMRSEPKKKTSPAKESPKAAGSDPAGSPAFSLKDWSMGATLLESVVEADSWKLRLAHGSWTIMWYDPDEMKPRFEDLKIPRQEVEEEALYSKIRAEIKEERKLLQLVKDQEDPQKPADPDTKAAETKVEPSTKSAPKEAESKSSEDASSGEDSTEPDTKPAAKDVVKPEPLGYPIDFEEVAKNLKAAGREPTQEACVAFVLEALHAEVVEKGYQPINDYWSVMAERLLIPNEYLNGLRVVGIGPVDSSGSRGRFARITKVTNARVEVEFEDKDDGFYFNKNKAEPVDKHGISLITGHEVFSKEELEEAARFRKAARTKNKLDKKKESVTSPVVLKERKRAPGFFARSPSALAGSDQAHKKRKTEHGMEKDRAEAFEEGMKALAQAIGHMNRAGVIPDGAFDAFRDALEEE